MADTRPTVLVLLGVFQPGLEATGPNQSMERMHAALGDRFRFRVVARAAAGEPAGTWGVLNGIERLALTKGRPVLKGLRRALSDVPCDLILANGMFDLELTVPALVMRRIGLIPRRPMMVAPRGEFSPGALALKAGRKRAFLALAQRLGILRDVAIQATTPDEARFLRQGIAESGPVLLGPNVRPLAPLPARDDVAAGGEQLFRIAFLSRIDRKKNLDFALRTIAAMQTPVEFRIYGPVSDEAYWKECEALIAAMPSRHAIFVAGAIPQRDVVAALAQSDLLFLPTLGENYGHAIVDALTAGTPVLISDQTPWRSLATEDAGRDLPLSNPTAFLEALEELARASPQTRGAMRAGARRYIERRLDPAADAAQLEQCLRAAMRPTEAK